MFHHIYKHLEDRRKYCMRSGRHFQLDRLLGSITSRCSGKEPALLPPNSGEGRPDTRERRKSSLLAYVVNTFSRVFLQFLTFVIYNSWCWKCPLKKLTLKHLFLYIFRETNLSVADALWARQCGDEPCRIQFN